MPHYPKLLTTLHFMLLDNQCYEPWCSFSSHCFFTFSILTSHHNHILHVSSLFRDNGVNIDCKHDFEIIENYKYPNYFSEIKNFLDYITVEKLCFNFHSYLFHFSLEVIWLFIWYLQKHFLVKSYDVFIEWIVI